MADYEVWLCDNYGNLEKNISYFSRLEYARKINEITWCQIDFNDGALFKYLEKDKRILIMKSIDNKPSFLAGDCCWLVRKWERAIKDNQVRTSLWGVTPNYLIDGREVLYASTSPQAKKVGKTPNTILTEIIQENLGNLAVSNRDLSTYLDIVTPTPSGIAINKSCAWSEVGKTLKEVCDLAAENGEKLFFDISYNLATKKFVFNTYLNQRGVDHSINGSSPVIFSAERGNLDDIVERVDYSNEITAGIALGNGDELTRKTNEQVDSARIAASIFGRRERTKNVSNSGADTPTELENEAKSILREGLPIKTFTAKLLQIGVRFDEHYGFGDRITMVNMDGVPIDCFLDGYSVTVSQGREDISTSTKEIQ